jgi:imidazolonepropionase-like amidohydrolase
VTDGLWHVSGVRVPDGAPVEWWVAGGRLSAEPVEGARDVPGRWVAEGGLVDAHVHLGFEPHTVFGLRAGARELVDAGLRAHREAGELRVRDAGSLPGTTPDDMRSGEGVALAGCGPFLAPAGHFMPHLHEPASASEAPERAARQIRSGWPWAKVIVDFPGEDGNPLAPRLGYEPTVLAEIAAAVHEAGGRLAVHVMGDSVDLAIEAGADSIEHGNLAHPDAVREMARRGIAWTPTLLTVAERYVEPIAAHVPPARALLELQRQTLPLAAEVGVTVLAGTDEEPHGSVAREVAALIRYGLPPEVAVAAATSAGHATLGGGDTPKHGDPARLVTFDADPVEDPSALARPAAVLASG